MNANRPAFASTARGRASLSIAILITLLCGCGCGCGTNRPPQTEQSLLERRAQYVHGYLDATNVRYTAVLNRNKQQLDEYKAGKRSEPPTIDYLVISGGGDVGAFGAGFLKGWATVPKSDPLARPRFDLVTG